MPWKDENLELKRALQQSTLALDAVLQAREEGTRNPEGLQEDSVRPRGYEPGGNGRGEGLGASACQRPPPGLCDRPTEPAVVAPGRGEGERQPTRGFLREAAGRLFGQDGTTTQSGPSLTTQPQGLQGDPLQLLVQGMRQLQQVHIAKKEGSEHEAPKSGIDLPNMPDLTGDAAVEFNDWLYVAEQVVGSLTETWFSMNLNEACARYQVATPLERLAVVPARPVELSEVKWSRLERRVATMLLGAMPKVAKEDAVTHRLHDVASMLFRLHVLFQPGGNAERAAILRHLDGAPGGDNVGDTVAQLRRWRRYLVRRWDFRYLIQVCSSRAWTSYPPRCLRRMAT